MRRQNKVAPDTNASTSSTSTSASSTSAAAIPAVVAEEINRQIEFGTRQTLVPIIGYNAINEMANETTRSIMSKAIARVRGRGRIIPDPSDRPGSASDSSTNTMLSNSTTTTQYADMELHMPDNPVAISHGGRGIFISRGADQFSGYSSESDTESDDSVFR
jgi:hypothetical protein